MNSSEAPENPKKPEEPIGAQGAIFAVVGAGCGIFSAIRLSSVLPVWAALLVTIVLWILLVGGMTGACGAELLDILMGSACIIFVMTVMVAAVVYTWQHKHPKVQPDGRTSTTIFILAEAGATRRGEFAGDPWAEAHGYLQVIATRFEVLRTQSNLWVVECFRV